MRGSRFAAGVGAWVGQAIDAAALHGVEAYSDLPEEAVEALTRLSRELWPELEEVDRDHGRLLARGVSALSDAGDDVDEAGLRVAAELVDEMALTEAQREAVLAYGMARTLVDGLLEKIWGGQAHERES